MELTDQDLAALAMLESQATPGEWHYVPPFAESAHAIYVLQDVPPALLHKNFLAISHVHYPKVVQDFALMVAARNALPNLLRRLVENEELKAQHERDMAAGSELATKHILKVTELMEAKRALAKAEAALDEERKTGDLARQNAVLRADRLEKELLAIREVDERAEHVRSGASAGEPAEDVFARVEEELKARLAAAAQPSGAEEALGFICLLSERAARIEATLAVSEAEGKRLLGELVSKELLLGDAERALTTARKELADWEAMGALIMAKSEQIDAAIREANAEALALCVDLKRERDLWKRRAELAEKKDG